MTMGLRRSRVSTSVRSEGGLLPADLLAKVAAVDQDVPGLTDADFGLATGDRLREAITRSWNRLVGLWAVVTAAKVSAADVHDPLTRPTRERWLLPLFEELGFGRLAVAKAVAIEGTTYPISHSWEQVPIHLVGIGVELDRRTPGVRGAAGAAPHALVQEYLNRSDDALWGIVSNGRLLRLLRDSTSLTRQAFIEFDLEAIFEGELYADFALLWSVCHATRFEAARPEGCLLERWTRKAADDGTRALEQLRGGVERAIETLGAGFLAHPANGALREALRAGELDRQDYYRELLRLVYRLIFLFTAEDRHDEMSGRELLLDPAAPDAAAERYRLYYSTARLRAIAGRKRGTRHADLWVGLHRVIAALGGVGAPTLALPALGSFLFGSTACPHLDGANLRNEDLLDAVRALATIEEDRRLRLVDYRNLGAEELGGIYEGLLELHPRIEVDATPPRFTLATATGNERKATGSYYTPTSLITCLLDSALDPVVEEAIRDKDREAAEGAILDLAVVDPAAGSGHFLVAAAHRLAKRLAAIRTGEGEPGPAAIRHAVRDVIAHCIYAVDLNPMAVELCKVSLWLEALEPGRPLSFLDAHIKVGNSLLGTTPGLVGGGIPDVAYDALTGDDKAVARAWRNRNRQERDGQQALFEAPFEIQTEALAKEVRLFDLLPEETPEAVAGKAARHAAYVASTDYRLARAALDAWCAAFVAPKSLGAPEITTATVRAIGTNPATVPSAVRDLVEATAAEYAFIHWPLEFPAVFERGGFDVVVGNPPYVDSETLSREAPRARAAIGAMFPDVAVGNWDLYVIFVGLAATSLVRRDGRVALLTPIRIMASDYCAALQRTLLKREMLAFHDFSRVPAFADAQVSVGSVVSRNRVPSESSSVAFVEHGRDMSVTRVEEVPQRLLSELPPGYICFPLTGGNTELLALYSSSPRLRSVAAVSDGATTAEAYEIRAIVREGSQTSARDPDVVLLVNTGTVDPFHFKWGETETAYLRGRFRYPTLSVELLRGVSATRLDQAHRRKVIVGGMGSRLEAAAEDGRCLCGKSAVLVLPTDGVDQYALAAILNSRLVNRIYRGLFGLRGMGEGSMNIGPRQVEQLPIPPDRRVLRPALHPVEALHLDDLAQLDDGALVALMTGSGLLSALSRLLHTLPPQGGDFEKALVLVEQAVTLAFQAVPTIASPAAGPSEST
jgi:hypothetical protein